jgi:hypothetical protein
MIYKESKGSWLTQGLIKKCPVDWKAINNLIRRAYIDLKTATRNMDDDEECAYNYAYNAMCALNIDPLSSSKIDPS